MNTRRTRSSWTGGPGRPDFPRRRLPNLLHRRFDEQIRHAMRSAIDSPETPAPSARNRYPKSGSSWWHRTTHSPDTPQSARRRSSDILPGPPIGKPDRCHLSVQQPLAVPARSEYKPAITRLGPTICLFSRVVVVPQADSAACGGQVRNFRSRPPAVPLHIASQAAGCSPSPYPCARLSRKHNQQSRTARTMRVAGSNRAELSVGIHYTTTNFR